MWLLNKKGQVKKCRGKRISVVAYLTWQVSLKGSVRALRDRAFFSDFSQVLCEMYLFLFLSSCQSIFEKCGKSLYLAKNHSVLLHI